MTNTSDGFSADVEPFKGRKRRRRRKVNADPRLPKYAAVGPSRGVNESGSVPKRNRRSRKRLEVT